MERYVRINSLTLKVENALEAEEASIKNSPDYDLWIKTSTAQIGDTYDIKTSSFSEAVPYPDDDKFYTWDEETTNWKEII